MSGDQLSEPVYVALALLTVFVLLGNKLATKLLSVYVLLGRHLVAKQLR